MSLPSEDQTNRSPTKRWFASPWGALVIIGVLVILVAGSLKLVHRYSSEGRLRSYVPESIRETCSAEYTTSLIKIHYVATEGYPSAIAGLYCKWKAPTGNLNSDILMTYLLQRPGDADGRLSGSPHELPHG